MLLQTIIKSICADLRCAYIGQTIVSVTRPRAFIVPLQIDSHYLNSASIEGHVSIRKILLLRLYVNLWQIRCCIWLLTMSITTQIHWTMNCATHMTGQLGAVKSFFERTQKCGSLKLYIFFFQRITILEYAFAIRNKLFNTLFGYSHIILSCHQSQTFVCRDPISHIRMRQYLIYVWEKSCYEWKIISHKWDKYILSASFTFPYKDIVIFKSNDIRNCLVQRRLWYIDLQCIVRVQTLISVHAAC